MDRINFKINEKPYTVGSEVSSSVSLLDYLRQQAELRGTKYMCREGGCGACLVSAARPGAPPGAVNSCLVSITSCQDWEITTIEYVGNRLTGYHPLQKTLAKCNGSQCGYCSPGWIMAMYSLLKSKKNLTMLEIEQSFGSNVCRCTGYRPILDAFKQFASDAPIPNRLLDIEDLYICKKTGESCKKRNCSESDWCLVNEDDIKVPTNIELKLKDGKFWFKVQTVKDIFNVLSTKGDDNYMLVAGNTAKGAYPKDVVPGILIDISGIADLTGYHVDSNLSLGANSTLTETMEVFRHLAETQEQFWYLDKLRQHLLLVAHIPVRNLGTIAGNLMIKHEHNDFQSDVFLLLETVGASLTIVDSQNSKITVSPESFLKVNMKGKVILYVLFPPLSREYRLTTFKIMPRAQNVRAIVNAGFLYKLNSSSDTVESAKVVFGGLSDTFVHAVETERYLTDKKLFNNDTIQEAIHLLDKELVVEERLPEPSAKYRKALAISLFYKGILQLCPSNLVKSRYQSGARTLSAGRPVSRAKQVFDTDPLLWPLNQPMPRVDALIQCSGEASYTDDFPKFPREVFGAFVLSSVAVGDIASVDPSSALNQPGVRAFYSAKDIPGVNSFTMAPSKFNQANEEVFCSGKVKYHGQVIGVVVADTRTIAEAAAKLVHIKYMNVKKPVTDIREAMDDKNRVNLFKKINVKKDDTSSCKVIKGKHTIYGQYHFCMETLVCVTKPTEEGFEVHSTTQYMDSVQVTLSRALNILENKIDVHVRRLGGAFGLKVSRPNQLAVVSTLVAMKLNRPCRILLPLTTTMKTMGKRFPCAADFEVAVDVLGKIRFVDLNLYSDNGYVFDEPIILVTMPLYRNCYDSSRFLYKAYNVTTDTPSNTWCRSPGALEAVATAEIIMEQTAYEMSMDPLELRLKNLGDNCTPLAAMVDRVKSDGDYEIRRAAVDKFNAENRWKKRGLRFSLLRWEPYPVPMFDVLMSVYSDDGTVSITHGGIDMGQGVNTKMMQICSHLLNIPMEMIQIKSNNTHASPNTFFSGGSMTSINIGIAVRKCCEQILSRLDPLRLSINNVTWELLVKAACVAGIDLQAHGYVGASDVPTHEVFGVTLAEVEIDVLTGEWEILRVDILEDAGQSYSPEIDIGQVEGAFMMGVGYWTCEKLVHDPNTGELLTDRTWDYHVPQALDIPQDIRVYFQQKSYSLPCILGAKSIGEPPICMSIAIPFAMREAICSARRDAGIPCKEWFQMDGPFTREAIQLAAATDFKDFKIN